MNISAFLHFLMLKFICPRGHILEQAHVNVGKVAKRKGATEGFGKALWYGLDPEEKEANDQGYRWKYMYVTGKLVKRS